MNQFILTHLFLVSFSLSLFAESWQIHPESWVATDQLGRSVLSSPQQEKKTKNRTVAMFYYLWNGSHSNGLHDISLILSEHPEAEKDSNHPAWGKMHHWHFWGKPLFGYYFAADPWVIRKHAQMLTDAGVDAIFFDATNAISYPKVYEVLLKTYTQMNAEGQDTPKIAFLTNAGSGKVARKVYENLYKNGRYKQHWFFWKGKPLILAKAEELNDELNNFFSVKRSWAWQHGKNRWPWLERSPQKGGWSDDKSVIEQMSVSVASHPTNSKGKSYRDNTQPSDYDNSSGLGWQFSEQWERAIEIDPDIVMVTQWNEWTAQRFKFKHEKGTYATRPIKKDEPYFVDVYNKEFNRDLEPMEGEYSDNYYYQLIDYVRKYKNNPIKIKPVRFQSIDEQDLNAWQKVKTEYRDDLGDIKHRDHRGFGDEVYKNNSGRNDFKLCKMSMDSSFLYMYVETNKDISDKSSGGEFWMNAFIRNERSKSNGWEGFQFRLANTNATSPNLTLLKSVNGWTWQSIAEVKIIMQGNKMSLAIPLELLKLKDEKKVKLSFKWSDNQLTSKPESWLLNGDTAPNARFRYLFNCSETLLEVK